MFFKTAGNHIYYNVLSASMGVRGLPERVILSLCVLVWAWTNSSNSFQRVAAVAAVRIKIKTTELTMILNRLNNDFKPSE